MSRHFAGFSCRCFTFMTVATAIVLWLVPIQPSFSEDAASPSRSQNFSVLDGKGVPVCEAYLELLNKTRFERTPFCGRPHEGAVKGFEHLEGHFMNLEEISPLFTKVWEFMRFGDQGRTEKYGATGVGKMCGTDYAGSTWQLSYINQRAFVLTADRKSIDETQTRLVFGAPRGVPRSVTRSCQAATSSRDPMPSGRWPTPSEFLNSREVITLRPRVEPKTNMAVRLSSVSFCGSMEAPSRCAP